FADSRFVYADLGPDPNHSAALHSLFVERPEQHARYRAAGRGAEEARAAAAQAREALERAAAAAGKRTLVVSAEDVCQFPADALARMNEHFKARFGKVTVVGYVRPPAGLMTSAFQQRLKGGSLRQVKPARLYRSYRQFLEA